MSNVVPVSDQSEVERTRQVVESILTDRNELPGGGWTASLLSERGSHGGTLLFLARSEATGQTVAAKLYRRPEEATLEHRGARAIHDLGVGMARPIFCDAERGVYVSEWIEGESLEDLLLTDSRDRALTEAGRWLSRLHRRGQASRPRLFRPSQLLVRLCDTTAGLPGWVPDEQRAAFAQAVGKVSRRIAGLSPAPYRPVRLHGDYVPSNLILSPDGPLAFDLAAMNVRLATMAEEGPAAGAFDGDDARETFLAAYGLTGQRARKRLALLEAAELLRRWRNFARTTYREPTVRDGEIRAIRAILTRRGLGEA